MENCEVMTSSTHSFAYSYRLVKKCFLKICETSKCHNFLIFQPIFIRFLLLCLKFFTLSSKIKLILLWSSSLIFSVRNKLLKNKKLKKSIVFCFIVFLILISYFFSCIMITESLFLSFFYIFGANQRN